MSLCQMKDTRIQLQPVSVRRHNLMQMIIPWRTKVMVRQRLRLLASLQTLQTNVSLLTILLMEG